MSASSGLSRLLNLFVILDQGVQSASSLDDFLAQVKPILFPQALAVRVYRVSGNRAIVHGGTQPGADMTLDESPVHAQAVRQAGPAHDRSEATWVAALLAGETPVGLLEVTVDPLDSMSAHLADELRLALRLLAPSLLQSFAADSDLPTQTDDALSLVQALYATSGVVFGTENPVEILRSIHNFTGGIFASAQLGLIEDATSPGAIRIVAESDSSGTRAASIPARLEDYPASEALVALEALSVPDVAQDRFLTDDERARLRAQGIGALVIVPLVVSLRLTGFIVFTHPAPRSLSPARLRALRSIADQLAVVLENRALLDEAQTSASQLSRQVRLLEAINVVATQINSLQDEQALLDASTRTIVTTLDISHGGLVLFNPTRTVGTVVSEYPPQGAVGLELDMTENELYQAMFPEPGQPVLVNNVDGDPRVKPSALEVFHTLGIKSILITPLLVQDRIIGALGLDIYDDRLFTPEMVEIAQTMITQLSLGLQNIRLRTDAQLRAEQLQRIASFGQAVQATLDINTILDIALTEILRAIRMDRLNIAFYDARVKSLRAVAQYESGQRYVGLSGGGLLSMNNPFIAQVWQSGEFLHIPNTTQAGVRRGQEGGVRALMIAPLRSRGQLRGLVNAGALHANAFSDTDIAVFQQMMSQLASAIENAEAYMQSRRAAENEALLNEIATQFQQRLDIQHMLDVTVNELGRALGARRARIHLAISAPDGHEETRE